MIRSTFDNFDANDEDLDNEMDVDEIAARHFDGYFNVNPTEYDRHRRHVLDARFIGATDFFEDYHCNPGFAAANHYIYQFEEEYDDNVLPESNMKLSDRIFFNAFEDDFDDSDIA